MRSLSTTLSSNTVKSQITSPRGKPHGEPQRAEFHTDAPLFVSQHYAKANISQQTGAFTNKDAFVSNLNALTRPGTVPNPPDDIDSLAMLGQGDKVIDAGCGLGVTARIMAQKGADVIAYTPSSTEADALKEHQHQHPNLHAGVDYRQANSLKELGVAPGSIARIRLDRVMPYMDEGQRDTFLTEAKDALQPGGQLFCNFYHDASRIEHGSAQTLTENVKGIVRAGLTPGIQGVYVDASRADGSPMKIRLDSADEFILNTAVLSSEDGSTGLQLCEETLHRIGQQCVNEGAAWFAVRVNLCAVKPGAQ